MSVLSKEIKELLHHIADHEDGKITAEISFPKNFTGFEGHFPGKPVVPGVCKVLSVVALLELSSKQKGVFKDDCLVEVHVACHLSGKINDRTSSGNEKRDLGACKSIIPVGR